MENENDRPSIKRFGPLAMLAFFGFTLSIALLVLSVVFRDS
jgi:hypothetical protein